MSKFNPVITSACPTSRRKPRSPEAGPLRNTLLSISGQAVLAMVLLLALLAMPLKRAAGGSRLVALAAPGLGVQPCGRLRKTPTTYRHVVWVVMENKDYSQIVGSSDAPYINRIARNCGLASNFLAESHPSLPNYIAMTSGSTQGISGDPYPADSPLAVASIFSQLGRHWRALEESMPSNCGRSSQGPYDVNHNPAAYYTNISGQCAGQDVPLTRRASLSARFTFVTPNLCHDMHSCPTGSGDNWLSTWLPRVLNSSQYRSGSTAVFVTWDENDLTANEHVATIVISPYTRPGTRSARRFTHYSLLRTTEDMLGIRTHLGNAARAASMRGAFHL